MAAISRNQAQVLIALIRHKYTEMTCTQVVKATSINAVQAGKLLDGLRVSGLTTIHASPDDGNSKFYSLTNQGRLLARKLLATRRAFQAPSTTL